MPLPRYALSAAALPPQVGEEGFYLAGLPQTASNPQGAQSWANTEGQSFAADHASPDIDFMSIHLWINNWWAEQGYGVASRLTGNKEIKGATAPQNPSPADTLLPLPAGCREDKSPAFVQRWVQQHLDDAQVRARARVTRSPNHAGMCAAAGMPACAEGKPAPLPAQQPPPICAPSLRCPALPTGCRQAAADGRVWGVGWREG